MWRRKDPEEYEIEVRDYEGEDGKFLVSLAGNMVLLGGRRGFPLSGKQTTNSSHTWMVAARCF